MKKILALVAVAAMVAFAAPAFAANPFMDVPMNHWAYDAISQLAASGVINGYPDATFKGNQPMSRYEMATIVARGLAVVDMTKASKQDVEMLKRLVVEFKDELDALGVTVANIDERLAVMEENLGGWKLWGAFRFDTKLDGGTDTVPENYFYNVTGERDMTLSRYRLYLKKQVNDTTVFQARLGGEDATFERYWVETQLPWDITMKVGKFNIDWEDEVGLYTDNDAFAADHTGLGYLFTKSWGMADIQLYIGHEDRLFAVQNGNVINFFNDDRTLAGLNINANFNEKFRAGLMALYEDVDEDAWRNNGVATGNFTLVPNFTINFTPAIAFKGAYYMQNVDYLNGTPLGIDDSPSAFKAILDVSQEAFGFTSLWLEYANMDSDFLGSTSWMTADEAYDNYGPAVLANRGTGDTTVIYAKAEQEWNDKFGTFLRYVDADFDMTGVDNTTNYSLGASYQFNPAVKFELIYDKIDYGVGGGMTGDDSLIRFRTEVNF